VKSIFLPGLLIFLARAVFADEGLETVKREMDELKKRVAALEDDNRKLKKELEVERLIVKKELIVSDTGQPWEKGFEAQGIPRGIYARSLWDGPGGLWVRNALLNKFGSVFCSTASQHGGQETTITSFHTTLLHHGMLIIGLPYKFTELSTMSEITGGTPYGASCVAGVGASARMPTELELRLCRYQGEHVASIVSQFVRGSAGARP